MVECVEVMLERWKPYGGKEIELSVASYVEGKDIFQMLRKLTSIISRNAHKIQLPIFKARDNLESEMIDRFIRKSFIDIVEKIEKESGGEVNSFGDDFLGSLMKAHYSVDDCYKVTMDDMIGEFKTFYIAGHETTTGETLRLYPPTLSLIRRLKHEVNLGKLKIPGNTRLHFPVLFVHHDTEIWGEDAHLFKPQRFSQGVAKATNNNPEMFIPFGSGPRRCPGSNFATKEAKIALSMILQRYSFTLSPAYVHSPCEVLTLWPKFGIPIFLHPL
ncbi:hypothetical protein L1987_12187 [Smallanthus sonchifolius]|uniref:Uncharacterized protein n=1 Tax=Smallanthus sonchifolius TaxID=185202 RepID=A0ACB9JF89_9ASTR|nr:hypothetical protein L1987_12187 [Smallanthus sonchifolius]